MSITADRPRLLTAISFVLGLATIAGAWGSQLIGGLVPCELCLEQRLPYYLGLPVLALILIFWNRLPRIVWYVAMAIAIATFVWSTWLAGYHSGVEWHWWPGPTACTGTGVTVNFNDLNNINATRVIPCDAVQFRFLGLSLAGYNALISIAIVAMLLAATVLRGRKAA
ncbi:disulfide bond formation protein B [Devosia sp. ZB163]|uniref:disulfide bond formation protein B n=1 Tax=Devosia sp. ZB163 TaxID=3025938 RepID=UPI00235F9F77|nr:disulfide bond formation protein B [Devosia sp. ZB163]MDC9826464.1 disulfide bond formation protein B [Devosia sp. ZB163]